MTDFYMCSTQQCLCMYIILLHTLVTLGNKSSFGLKKKRKKGQKGKHVSSLFKRTQKLVRYIRCFSKRGLCLHFNSFFQQILVYCTSQILYFRGFIIHLSICYHIFSGSVFLHSIPRRLLEDLLFFDLSVMFCFNLFLFGSLFSYSFLIAFIHVFFGFFLFFNGNRYCKSRQKGEFHQFRVPLPSPLPTYQGPILDIYSNLPQGQVMAICSHSRTSRS